ncbi:hypothetical protein GOV03_03600 [Candidatus Woesearchaeota archaeon]|nr:hypothetical protein [Candidatus Woesearchaeota archaeon]
MKRGQMEMIGLVVIVILITLGMLFMAQFALKDDPTKKIFVRKGLAYSTMGALMKTSVACDDRGDDFGEKFVRMTELMKDCAEYYGEPSGYMCDNKQSCEFLQELIGDLLTDTLGTWQKHYEFKSSLLGFGDSSETLIEFSDEDEKGCKDERDTSGLFPINSDAGLIENILYLCD